MECSLEITRFDAQNNVRIALAFDVGRHLLDTGAARQRFYGPPDFFWRIKTVRQYGEYQAQQNLLQRVGNMDTATFITFMVMWMLLLFGALIIFLTYRHNRHLIDLNHKERMNALERGLEMPATPVQGEESTGARRGYYLYRGLIFALLGASLMAALGINAGMKSALWGLPLTAFGVAYLILYAMGKPRV
jgi:hypothetical protein